METTTIANSLSLEEACFCKILMKKKVIRKLKRKQPGSIRETGGSTGGGEKRELLLLAERAKGTDSTRAHW